MGTAKGIFDHVFVILEKDWAEDDFARGREMSSRVVVVRETENNLAGPRGRILQSALGGTPAMYTLDQDQM